jgi:outer membrane protein TolC
MFLKRQLATLFVAVLSISLLWQTESLPAQDATAQVKALRKERVELLDDVVKHLTNGYSVGAVSFDTLIKAKDQALQAKLELADSPEERIGVLRKLVENANMSIRHAQEQVKVGIAKDYEVLQAKAHLLEIRIDLVKEEQKIKPANPK